MNFRFLYVLKGPLKTNPKPRHGQHTENKQKREEKYMRSPYLDVAAFSQPREEFTDIQAEGHDARFSIALELFAK